MRVDDRTEWLDFARDLLHEANVLKFSSNEYLQKALFDTSSRSIGESTKNKDWGIGLNLDDHSAKDVAQWTGKMYPVKQSFVLGQPSEGIATEVISNFIIFSLNQI